MCKCLFCAIFRNRRLIDPDDKVYMNFTINYIDTIDNNITVGYNISNDDEEIIVFLKIQ